MLLKELTDRIQEKCELVILAEKARNEQDLVQFKEALAKKALEAETSGLVAEREKIKCEIMEAQAEFHKRQNDNQKKSQDQINHQFLMMHGTIMKELDKTLKVVSRRRKVKVTKTDSDGTPTEATSEIE